jgi:hypothetical protein
MKRQTVHCIGNSGAGAVFKKTRSMDKNMEGRQSRRWVRVERAEQVHRLTEGGAQVHQSRKKKFKEPFQEPGDVN